MPSPLGHALAGVAAGWTVAGVARESRSTLVVQAAILAGLATAPDLDLFTRWHSGPTHSVGAAAIAGVLAAWGRWPIASTRPRIALAAFAAWATHPLLDALAPDNSPPIGVMAFWPMSTSYFLTGWSVFMAIWRTPGSVRAVMHDVVAVIREVAILGPIAFAVWRFRSSVSVGREPFNSRKVEQVGKS